MILFSRHEVKNISQSWRTKFIEIMNETITIVNKLVGNHV